MMTRIDIPSGMDISEAIEGLTLKANSMNATFVADFNGVDLIASPGMSANDVVSKWHEERRMIQARRREVERDRLEFSAIGAIMDGTYKWGLTPNYAFAAEILAALKAKGLRITDKREYVD